MFYILCFFAYSFLGWVCECIYCSIPAKKFINRGFLEEPTVQFMAVELCLLFTCSHLLPLSHCFYL